MPVWVDYRERLSYGILGNANRGSQPDPQFGLARLASTPAGGWEDNGRERPGSRRPRAKE